MPSDYQKKKLAKKKEASKVKGGKKPSASQNDPTASENGSDNESQNGVESTTNGVDKDDTKMTYEGNSWKVVELTPETVSISMTYFLATATPCGLISLQLCLNLWESYNRELY